jgi:hypothetical protein
MAGSYRTARIVELERPDGWSPIRRELGIEAFGVNAWTSAAAGGRLIAEHDEDSGHEEPCAEVERVLAEHLAIRVCAEVLEPGQLPRSEGKAVRVVDRPLA